MSGVRQTCTSCGWSRHVELRQTADREYDDLIARHVARSLQWEWQVHMKDVHPMLAAAWDCLKPAGYDDWVKQESTQQVLKQETPPDEGGGQTVGVNLPTITPHQAKQLADTIEHTMLTAAEGIQRFAEHMVPALHSAQEQIVNNLRAIVEQRPGRSPDCTCGGAPSGHQPGQEGCLYGVAVDLTSTRILKDAAQLAPGARSPEFWQNLYSQVPVAQPQCLCDGTGVAHRRGDPSCLFLDAEGTLNPDTPDHGKSDGS